MQYSSLDEPASAGMGSAGAAVNNNHPNSSDRSNKRFDNDDAVSYKTSKSHRSRGGRTVTSELEEPLNEVELGQVDNKSALDEDPFYVLRNDLYIKLELVDESLAEFLRIVYQTDTAVNSHEVKEAKKNLKRHLKNAESTLKDVKTTLTVVENDRVHFAHIDNSELYDRRSLVHTSHDRITKAKSEMTSETVKAKLLADERAKALRRNGADGNGSTLMGARNDSERENTAFIADSQARASLLFQQQDETLEDLDEAVIRVGRMAETIHEEIGVQNKMLSELDEDLTQVEEELGVVMGKLAKLLQTKSKWQLGTILLLTLLMIVLFFLVIYT